MEPNQAFLSNVVPDASLMEATPVCQVWMNLTLDQQTRLLQAIVLTCREVVWPVPQIQQSEVADD